MPKVCSRKKCRRTHDTKYKKCPTCREINRRSLRKCKLKAFALKVPPGHRRCTRCTRVEPENQFRPIHARRAKLTALCLTCRNITHRSQMNPNTVTGQCRQVWFDWKALHCCAHCGTTRHIEADHCKGDKKVHRCGDYTWWARNGGPEAQQRELEKCQPLCMFCHRVKTEEECGNQTTPCTLRRRQIINDEKLRMGACETCNRTVTLDNTQCFDWAHRDRATKINIISALVYTNEEYFQKQWPLERAKCKLLCCMCHRDETVEENKRDTLLTQSKK